jgi:glycosyltransferase involved in cell wall biosynthesis
VSGYLVNRKFDFSDIWNNPQGLTGSELSYLKVARKMVDRGHEVHIYTLRSDSVDSWEGIPIHDYKDRSCQEVDVAFSWNESEPLRQMRSGTFNVVSWQLNKLDHCTPDVDSFVDLWMCPSEVHRSRMMSGLKIGLVYGVHDQVYTPDPAKWKVVPHGCEPKRYRKLETQKVPGRVIWASSPGRGLHWILQEWPKIRRSVPHAVLRVFYNMETWIQHFLSLPDNVTNHPDITEQKSRALYIREAIRRLKDHGVEIVDSVSRNRIDQEMAEAEVLAYPCDPVTWTEGFSIALMESCAARACPITTNVDALPSIYGGIVPMVDLPVREHIGEFSDLVIRALTDRDYRDGINDRAEALGKSHSWDSVADTVEELVRSGIASRD